MMNVVKFVPGPARLLNSVAICGVAASWASEVTLEGHGCKRKKKKKQGVVSRYNSCAQSGFLCTIAPLLNGYLAESIEMN